MNHPNENLIRMAYLLNTEVKTVPDYVVFNNVEEYSCIVEQNVSEWYIKKPRRKI